MTRGPVDRTSRSRIIRHEDRDKRKNLTTDEEKGTFLFYKNVSIIRNVPFSATEYVVRKLTALNIGATSVDAANALAGVTSELRAGLLRLRTILP